MSFHLWLSGLTTHEFWEILLATLTVLTGLIWVSVRLITSRVLGRQKNKESRKTAVVIWTFLMFYALLGTLALGLSIRQASARFVIQAAGRSEISTTQLPEQLRSAEIGADGELYWDVKCYPVEERIICLGYGPSFFDLASRRPGGPETRVQVPLPIRPQPTPIGPWNLNLVTPKPLCPKRLFFFDGNPRV